MTAGVTNNYRWLVKLLCFVGFLDLFAVSMILPLIATRAKSLGANSLLVGLIGSIHGAVQLVSSPSFGSWSDTRGRKYVLMVSLCMSAIGYFIMGSSSLLIGLIMSRFIIGTFKHSLTLSQAYLANIVSVEEKGIFYGYFTASSNIGFIVGPVFGGHLAELPNGFFWVTTMTSVLFLLNGVIVWHGLPTLERSVGKDIARNRTAENNDRDHRSKIGNSLTAFITHYHNKLQLGDCWDIMSLRFVLGFATLIYRSSFSLILEEKFNFTPKYTGYLISFQGTVSAIAGFLVGHLTRLEPNENLQLLYGALSLFVALLGLTISPGVTFLVISLSILCVSTSFLRVCLSQLLASRCPKDKLGVMFGLGQSVTSAARMLAPLMGGIAMEMGPHGPPAVGTFTSAFGLCLSAYLCIRTSPKQKLS